MNASALVLLLAGALAGAIIMLIAWREVLRARAWVAWFARRVFGLLDRLEEAIRTSPGEILAPPPPDDEDLEIEDDTPETPLPDSLYSMNDEVQAKLESMRRNTRGADQSLVCSHWFEQDEREAEAEALRLREQIKKLKAAN